MKRIKIMLTAIAVFAIVGGALAFKAKKGSTIYCATVPNYGAIAGTPLCPTLLNSSYTITNFNPISFCTTVIGTPCTVAVSRTFTKL